MANHLSVEYQTSYERLVEEATELLEGSDTFSLLASALDRQKFSAWLHEQDSTRQLGNPNRSQECPLHMFIVETFQPRETISMGLEDWGHGYRFLRVPAWAEAFQVSAMKFIEGSKYELGYVNDVDTPISVAQCLRVLDSLPA